jgi:hypothetical protein
MHDVYVCVQGFTGAQASPLQCAPLADSCLALGAASCRAAAAAISTALQQGQLGPKGQAGKVRCCCSCKASQLSNNRL